MQSDLLLKRALSLTFKTVGMILIPPRGSSR